MVRVWRSERLRGSVQIPHSKPHCQRAFLLATLAEGESWIHNVNTCSETQFIAEACAAFGATLEYHGRSVRVIGVGGRPQRPERVLRLAGSGFALRNLLAVACLADGPTILVADKRMEQRPLLPLIDRLADLGARIEAIEPGSVLPLVNWGGRLQGGNLTVSAETTSQFATALLLVAPYADAPLTLHLPEPIVGREYIHLTTSLMQQFGVEVSATDDMHEITVHQGGYQARELVIGPDFTSLFYFIAAAVIVDTDVHIENVFLGADPALDETVAIGRKLGVQITQTAHGVRVCSGAPPRQRVNLEVAHVPTLVPAMAALASSLPYGLRITGAQHIQFHKTSRLAALLTELEKLGRQFSPIYERGALDGFETLPSNGRTAEVVDSHSDHRLFMALFLACLRAPAPTQVIGEETLVTSFPEFVECFGELGAQLAAPTVMV